MYREQIFQLKNPNWIVEQREKSNFAGTVERKKEQSICGCKEGLTHIDTV